MEEALEFLHFFERMGAPLHSSPRGRGKAERTYSRQAKYAAMAESLDVGSIAQVCPRTNLYSSFNPDHRAEAMKLRSMFLGDGAGERSFADFMGVGRHIRDNPRINIKLLIDAFSSAALASKECRHRQIPAVWEIMPDQFFDLSVIRQGRQLAELPESEREPIELDPTGHENNSPEYQMAYYREDPGLNSHHWHWHLLYRLEDKQQKGRRKGELFYYMHQAMVARYNTERLSNGLAMVVPLSFDGNPVIEDGYFSKLFESNAWINWGSRQDDTPVVDLNRKDLPTDTSPIITMDQCRTWLNRIREAIEAGKFLNTDGKWEDLDIDILGDIVEASELSPNGEYYGNLGYHNTGHVMIAFCHDPEELHVEQAGVMYETSTALRDPVFWRWHKHIDNIFYSYKIKLEPYQLEGADFPLAWPNVTASQISIQSTKKPEAEGNRLDTFFMKSRADLSRGLDFKRTDEKGPIWLVFKHLDHDPFNYSITVQSNESVRATIRIFMSPRFDETGKRFTLEEQWRLFFEMDKFTENLTPGENVVSRSSTSSTVTIPWEQTFRELERKILEETLSPEQSVCGCGWPQHLLVPKGTIEGQVFDLVMIITNGEEDRLDDDSGCGSTPCPKEALSICGRLGKPYPDKKPMGYPFDRKPGIVIPTDDGNTKTVESLEEYVNLVPNMVTTQVRVFHTDRTETRDDILDVE